MWSAAARRAELIYWLRYRCGGDGSRELPEECRRRGDASRPERRRQPAGRPTGAGPGAVFRLSSVTGRGWHSHLLRLALNAPYHILPDECCHMTWHPLGRGNRRLATTCSQESGTPDLKQVRHPVCGWGCTTCRWYCEWKTAAMMIQHSIILGSGAVWLVKCWHVPPHHHASLSQSE